MLNFVKIGQTVADITIFRFFQDGSAILDFQINMLVLTNDELHSSQMHHLAEFQQNWSSSCGDVAIFQFFNMAADGHLVYLSSGNLNRPRVAEFR